MLSHPRVSSFQLSDDWIICSVVFDDCEEVPIWQVVEEAVYLSVVNIYVPSWPIKSRFSIMKQRAGLYPGVVIFAVSCTVLLVVARATTINMIRR